MIFIGTAQRRVSNQTSERGAINNTDLTVSRDFPLREGMRAELRAEAFNVFNRTEFSDSSIFRTFGATNLVPTRGALGESTNPDFGMLDITQNGRTPRYLQISLRIVFLVS